MKQWNYQTKQKKITQIHTATSSHLDNNASYKVLAYLFQTSNLLELHDPRCADLANPFLPCAVQQGRGGEIYAANAGKCSLIQVIARKLIMTSYNPSKVKKNW